jgi:hypothetical protein
MSRHGTVTPSLRLQCGKNRLSISGSLPLPVVYLGEFMSDNVKPWPKATGRAEVTQQKPIMLPCDYRLLGAVRDLETQFGTIEPHNRLASAAHAMKAKIDAGRAEPQHPMFAISTGR